MDRATPKKIVNSDSRCFTCSSPSGNQDKVHIFGKSSINFQEIIQTSLNVDVSCFSNSGELFVCRKVCYKRLTKFQRASEKVREIRREIEEVFDKRELPRAKRLIRADEVPNIPDGDTVRENVSRVKASKSLQFGKDDATACTSSPVHTNNQDFSSWKRAPTYPPCFLSPIQSHPAHSLVFNAFPYQNMSNPRNVSHQFHPQLTSTPKSTRKQSQVQLKVQYPSKNINKMLTSSYQSIGKALAHGVPSQIAAAVMSCDSVRKHIVEKVLKIVTKEVAELCSKRNPSILRKCEKEDLEKFDLQLVCNEWRERAPVFYSFLLTSAVNKRTKNSWWFGSLALAGSILLKQINQEMSATASLIGILLKSKSIEVRIFVPTFLVFVTL